MRRILLLLGTFGMLSLAACLPVASEVPVGTTVGFRVDPALLGTWKAHDPAGGGVPAWLHILGNEDGSMTVILVDPAQAQSSGDWSVYRLHVAALGTAHIINAQEASNNGKASSGPLAQQNMLFAYKATGANTLTLYRMDDKATAAAIKAHEIAGEVEPGQDGDVRITAPEPALDKFFTSPRAAKLFSKPFVTLTRAN